MDNDRRTPQELSDADLDAISAAGRTLKSRSKTDNTSTAYEHSGAAHHDSWTENT